MFQSARKKRYFYLTFALVALLAGLACGVGGGNIGDSDDFIKDTLPAQDAAEVEEAEPTDVPATDTPEVPPTPTEVPPTPTPDVPTILIVIEDRLSGRPDFTSSDEISTALDAISFDHDMWSVHDDGQPSVGDLSDYGVVFWAVGDDCCDSPSFESIEAMKDYMDEGGNLFVEGGSVIYPWPNDPFTTSYLGIQHAGWSPLGDIVVEDADHPLAAGFPDGSIKLTVNGRVQPDTLNATQATAVFVRGPNSAERGKAAITAYDAGGYKAVMSAVPLQWFTSQDLQLLLQNAIDWFRS